MASCGIIMIANGSIYVGIFLYIDGMVKDMKVRISSRGVDAKAELYPLNIWTVYSQETDLHIAIIK